MVLKERCLQANFNKVRVIFWRSSMKMKASVTAESQATAMRAVTVPNIIRAIAHMPAKKFDSISPCARFYPGMKLVFCE